ncbi:hypothetical protein [Clavibacter michiganensis]|uniref:hypothetical protein n=1 Tax=Clavibacter michiganensis TaxID=28447 RepID=UPI003EBBB760
MNRSLPALALVGALALGGTLLAAAPAQAAPGTTYYSVPFSDSLISVAGDDAEDPGSALATYAEWKADGFPRPVPAKVAYRALPWDGTVFADVQGTVVSLALDLAEWRRAGSPTPTRNVLPGASLVIQNATSDELLVRTGLGWGTDAAEWHTMTFGEWRSLGYPAIDIHSGSKYERLAWLDTIVGDDPYTGESGPITFDTWLDAGRPTPKVVQAFALDEYCSTPGGAEIRYVGLAAPEGLSMTFRQWVVAGSPKPVTC